MTFLALYIDYGDDVAVNAASVGSPAMGVRLSGGGTPATTEEQAYLDKWKQLQKYIEPLRRMINKINKDEGTDH